MNTPYRETDFILIGDPDQQNSSQLEEELEHVGLRVETVSNGGAVLAQALASQPSLIILEIHLKDLDGWQVCRALKNEPATRTIPVVFCTHRTDQEERILGLELGAEDYVDKSCATRELVLRIQAILRRLNPPSQPAAEIRIGNMTIEQTGCRVSVEGQAIALTRIEFRLLMHLLERPGRVQTREMLLAQVWRSSPAEIDPRTVDTHIRRLRRKVTPLAALIKTQHGLGYMYQPTAAETRRRHDSD